MNAPSSANVPYWLSTDFGQAVWHWENNTLQQMSATHFGRIGLTLGIPVQPFHPNTISGIHFHGWFHTPHSPIASSMPPLPLSDKLTPLVLDPAALPLAQKSVDLLVAAHVLEMHDEPEYLLREWNRVLCDDGTLLITLFNPHSLLRFSSWMSAGFSPHWHKLTAKRLRDWFKLLGLSVQSAKFGVYRRIGKPDLYPCNAPVAESADLPKNQRWELIGNRWFAHFGAVVAVSAQKKTLRFIPTGKVRPWGLHPVSVQPRALPQTAHSNAINPHNQSP